ncbi:MAG: 50S ribosomal protein L35 [Acidimicrobiales bacterium]|jgi:large subunit ribosomal protein L35|nr:50S ribosomal protein L35 [Acidimicrobiaceae bacterium]MDP6281773.1 50S ribosomal protein L35 [Acidimicrobiales bacterium]MDP7118044.1 50S ribosomal protein L35 [Acidimicrobiales bacterium]MDP7411426.1 50S ribosomal protein L35 [Acidimicrobiales bacterium]MEE1522398.1 50S ribosomal protein L35 [Acidimicrobiales bacterium]
MPKMKTHRGLAKRIKVTGTGRLKRGTYVKKAVKLKRRRGRQLDVDPINEKSVRRKLGI